MDAATSVEPTNDIAVLRRWVGSERKSRDVASAATCRLLEAVLDRDPELDDGDPLPPLWHFMLHAEPTRQSRLGLDGHAARGGFLPPVALPRRMWAGGRIRFHAPIALGDVVDKTSTVEAVEPKAGRSGALCFVTVRHELRVGGEPRLTEEQDLVYRDPADIGDGSRSEPPAPTDHDWREIVEPDPVLLFRYSALTFNGHRIHYDREYCRREEGYPGLVVHGPLIATLLADLAVRRTGRTLRSFEFRAVAPLFDIAPFRIAGRADGDAVSLWAETPSGGLAMDARAALGAEA